MEGPYDHGETHQQHDIDQHPHQQCVEPRVREREHPSPEATDHVLPMRTASNKGEMNGYGVQEGAEEDGGEMVLPPSICGVVGDGRAIVKHSEDPQMEFWESMVEMIVGNGLSADMATLQFLLSCYLSLNDPHLHYTIHKSFLRALNDLHIA
mgnify:CR=1 FL=1